MRRVLPAALAAVLPLAAANAAQQTARIELHGYVPVICRADFVSTPSVAPSGEMQLGSIQEFCNAGSGYQVIVEYQPASDPGALVVDGRTIFLDGSGRAVIQQVPGPAIETSRLAYIPGHTPIASLHIAIQAASI